MSHFLVNLQILKAEPICRSNRKNESPTRTVMKSASQISIAYTAAHVMTTPVGDRPAPLFKASCGRRHGGGILSTQNIRKHPVSTKTALKEPVSPLVSPTRKHNILPPALSNAAHTPHINYSNERKTPCPHARSALSCPHMPCPGRISCRPTQRTLSLPFTPACNR